MRPVAKSETTPNVFWLAAADWVLTGEEGFFGGVSVCVLAVFSATMSR